MQYDNDFLMNSSKSRQPSNLAPAQAQGFLAELANLRPEPDATARFLRQFAAFIPERQHPFAAVQTLPYRERQPDALPCQRPQARGRSALPKLSEQACTEVVNLHRA